MDLTIMQSIAKGFEMPESQFETISEIYVRALQCLTNIPSDLGFYHSSLSWNVGDD